MSSDLNSYMFKTAKGDKRAFRFLANALGYKMYSMAKRLLGPAHIADSEDVVQISLIKIWQTAPRWVNKGSVEAYVYHIVFTTCMDLHRRYKSSELLSENYHSQVIANTQLPNKELRNILLFNIKKLPKYQQQAILLHYFCGYKQKEVSCIINKSEKATESLIIRARKKLKTILPKHLLEELLNV